MRVCQRHGASRAGLVAVLGSNSARAPARGGTRRAGSWPPRRARPRPSRSARRTSRGAWPGSWSASSRARISRSDTTPRRRPRAPRASPPCPAAPRAAASMSCARTGRCRERRQRTARQREPAARDAAAMLHRARLMRASRSTCGRSASPSTASHVVDAGRALEAVAEDVRRERLDVLGAHVVAPARAARAPAAPAASARASASRRPEHARVGAQRARQVDQRLADRRMR